MKQPRRSPSSRRDVFVDTSALVALAIKADNQNQRARAVRDNILVPGRCVLITTLLVLAETHALVLRRTGRPPFAASYLRRLYDGDLNVVPVMSSDERTALEILIRYQDKEFSFADAVSFSVMERLRIGRVFSYDSDFDQYGAPRGWERLA